MHALPALAAARKALPSARLDWVVERRNAEVLRGSPAIDRLIEIETRGPGHARFGGFRRQREELRSVDYDIAMDLQGLLKSGLVAKLSGAPRRIGFDRADLREPASRLFLTETVPSASDANVIDKNLGLVCSALGIAATPGYYGFPIAIGPEHRLEADAIARDAGPRFAILNPAAGWSTKMWPAANYGVLADLIFERHGLASVIVTGPGEEGLAEQTVAASRTGRCTRATPSLKGFVELAQRASVYVGGDTGPTHLAVAAGCPVVGIFGPTEWWRNGSPFADDVPVGRDDIECRVDCHRRACSAWICMEIPPKRILEAVSLRLASPARNAAHPASTI